MVAAEVYLATLSHDVGGSGGRLTHRRARMRYVGVVSQVWGIDARVGHLIGTKV